MCEVDRIFRMSVLQRHAAALGKPSPLDQLGARVACPCPFPADGPKNPVLGSLFVSHRLAAVHQSPLVTRAQSREGRVPTRTSPPTPRHARKGSLAGIPGGEQPAQLCVVACQEAEQRWLTPSLPHFPGDGISRAPCPSNFFSLSPDAVE